MKRRAMFWMPAVARAVCGQTVTAAVDWELPRRGLEADFPEAPADFDVTVWVKELSRARVNSLRVPAKGAAGYCYYETRVGRKHPGMQGDWLGAVVEACRGAGIAVHYQYPLGCEGGGPEEWAGGCLNSPYAERAAEENEEILERYDVAGVCYEVAERPPGGCPCPWCVAERRGGADAARQDREVMARARKRFSELVTRRKAQARVFFRERAAPWATAGCTHVEFERVTDARYARTLRRECVGVAADERECWRLLANGAKVAMRGGVSAASRAFGKAEALEPWLRGARAIVDFGLLRGNAAVERMLLAHHCQYDEIDEEADWGAYRAIVTGGAMTEKLRAYAARGGAVLQVGSGTVEAERVSLQAGAFPELAPRVFAWRGRCGSIEAGGGEILATFTSGSREFPLLVRGRRDGVYRAACAPPWPEVAAELLRMVVPKPAVLAPGLAEEVEVTFLEQRLAGGVIRRVGHILCAGVIENVRLMFRLPQHPLAVVTAPDQKPVEFVHNEFYTAFTLPRVEGHQAIAFE